MVKNIAILPPLLLIAAIIALALAIGFWPSGQADASGHGATRTLSTSSVAPGGEITVTINVTNLDSFGQVVETLPQGFSYVANSTNPSSVRTKESEQELRFTILGINQEFTYKVTASDTAGSYTFTGVVQDAADPPDSRVIPATSVTVTAAPGPSPSPEPVPPPVAPSDRGATRSLLPTTVDPGGEVTVTIAANYGSFGQVVETLPDGFSYNSSSVEPDTVRAAVDGQEVTFTLLGDTTFTYEVTASSAGGPHTFMGVLRDDEGTSHTISNSVVRVDAPAPTATRQMPPRVNPNTTLKVYIRPANYGDFGQVVETLPAGFSYVTGSVSLSGVRVAEDGQKLTFTLIGSDQSFSYNVTVPSGTGSHTFEGVLKTDTGVDITIDGASIIRVGAPAPPPGGGGGGGGGGTGGGGGGTGGGGGSIPATATPSGGDAPVIAGGTREEFSVPENTTAVATMKVIDERKVTWSVRGGFDADKFMIGAESGELAFKSAPDYESPGDQGANNVYVVQVAATDAATRSDTLLVLVTVTDVADESTPEPEPTAAPTATPMPEPTATPTAEPTVAPTATMAAPTATPEPTATPTEEPTATAMPEPTATSTARPVATATRAPTAEPTATAAPVPTDTAVPPTPRPTAEVAPTPVAPEEGGFPVGVILLIGIVVGLALVAGGALYMRSRR